VTTQEAIDHLKWLVEAANGNGDDGPIEGSDVAAVRELLAESERLRADVERLVDAIRMCDWSGAKVQNADVHEALDAAIDAAMKGGA